jgi:uncharacterized protein YndB with AHSA1/START domain
LAAAAVSTYYMDDDYARELHIEAPPAAVYAALTTLDGCSAWWAPASGSAIAGGERYFTFNDPDVPLILRVAEATEPAGQSSWIAWHVTACGFLADWKGSTLTFGITGVADGTTDLRFRHAGLSPRLECFEECQAGWNYYLPSLRAYAETGTGTPFRR